MTFDFGNFISGLNQKARRAMPTATRRAYAPALNPGTIFSSAKPPVTVPGAILGLTGKVTERIMLPVAIYEQGRQVFNPQDNILTRIGDLGSGIRNLASGKPYLEGRTSSVQRPQMPGLPADYKQTELAAGAAAERFRPGAGFPGQQAAADRAYESEKARVAQLTAQDPELQRYENERKAAKTQEDMNAARDIGMQIWAAKNPELAAKVKPGQSGYEAIQGTLAGNMARAGQGFGLSEQLVPTPQGFPTQVPGLPTGAGYSTGFGVTANLAPGAQTPPPYSTIRPPSELSGLGAAPLGTAQTSVFGQPEVMDPEQFEKLLKMVQK